MPSTIPAIRTAVRRSSAPSRTWPTSRRAPPSRARRMTIHAPLIELSKAEIIRRGSGARRRLRDDRVLLPAGRRRPRLRPLRQLSIAARGIPAGRRARPDALRRRTDQPASRGASGPSGSWARAMPNMAENAATAPARKPRRLARLLSPQGTPAEPDVERQERELGCQPAIRESLRRQDREQHQGSREQGRVDRIAEVARNRRERPRAATACTSRPRSRNSAPLAMAAAMCASRSSA